MMDSDMGFSMFGDELELTELRTRRAKCDTNQENCYDLVNQEFKTYAVHNMGWSALWKIVVPDLVAGLMFWVHYNENNVQRFKYCDSDSEDCTSKSKGYYR